MGLPQTHHLYAFQSRSYRCRRTVRLWCHQHWECNVQHSCWENTQWERPGLHLAHSPLWAFGNSLPTSHWKTGLVCRFIPYTWTFWEWTTVQRGAHPRDKEMSATPSSGNPYSELQLQTNLQVSTYTRSELPQTAHLVRMCTHTHFNCKCLGAHVLPACMSMYQLHAWCWKRPEKAWGPLYGVTNVCELPCGTGNFTQAISKTSQCSLNHWAISPVS